MSLTLPQRDLAERKAGRWLTTREAAKLLGISERTVRRLAAAGKLEAWRPAWDSRWRVRVRQDDLPHDMAELSELSELTEI